MLLVISFQYTCICGIYIHRQYELYNKERAAKIENQRNEEKKGFILVKHIKRKEKRSARVFFKWNKSAESKIQEKKKSIP